jgi:chemotaxis protein CheD
MLPQSSTDPAKAAQNPFMFGDSGIPLLFTAAYAAGAVKERLRVVIAGGAQILDTNGFFDIGKRNVVIARKLFWKNNVLITAEHVGGTSPRTMYLEIGSGHTWFTFHGEHFDL